VSSDWHRGHRTDPVFFMGVVLVCREDYNYVNRQRAVIDFTRIAW
jgi:hypothetical protein